MMNPHCNYGEVTINAKPVETKVVVRESEYVSLPVFLGRVGFYLGLLTFCLGFWVAVLMLVTKAITG